MRKLIIAVLLIGIVASPITVSVVSALGTSKSEVLEYYVERSSFYNIYYLVASKLMSNEVIRQLKEKEGMTVKSYIIRREFRKAMNQ